MKITNNFTKYALGITLALSSLTAAATDSGKVESKILFNCNISFHASGKSAYFILGYTNINGTGLMSCYDYVENVVEDIPLKIKIRGPGAGLGITGLNISGGQGGIGLNSSPDALLGQYLMVRGNAAVGVGAAVGTGLRIAKGSFDIAVQIQSTSGLGAGIDLLTFDIERDTSRKSAKTSMPKPPVVAEIPAKVETELPPVVQVQTSQLIELVDEKGNVVNRYRFQVK